MSANSEIKSDIKIEDIKVDAAEQPKRPIHHHPHTSTKNLEDYGNMMGNMGNFNNRDEEVIVKRYKDPNRIPELDEVATDSEAEFIDNPWDKSKPLPIQPKYNVKEWLEEHKHSFKPPICNKLMYSKQLKVMYIGGPNERKDFHIDCGEEFFYQIKGNIKLPTYQNGKRKIVSINEGEVFLLKARIPHSPQRPEEGSIGLVCERERIQDNEELDAMRWYCIDFDNNANENDILYEKWFYCSNLGTQLVPIVNEFKESIEYKTGKPTGEHIMKKPPVLLDEKSICDDPINLMNYIKKNEKKLKNDKCIELYDGSKTQTTIKILTGKFEFRGYRPCEIWIYVLKGNNIDITFHESPDREPLKLNTNDCIITRTYEQFKILLNDDDLVMMVMIRDDVFNGPGRKFKKKIKPEVEPQILLKKKKKSKHNNKHNNNKHSHDHGHGCCGHDHDNDHNNVNINDTNDIENKLNAYNSDDETKKSNNNNNNNNNDNNGYELKNDIAGDDLDDIYDDVDDIE